METTFATVVALFSAVLEERESATRVAMLRANRELLTKTFLFDIASEGADLAAHQEFDRALDTLTIGATAAEIAESPAALLKFLLLLSDLRKQTGAASDACEALERAFVVAAQLVVNGDLGALEAVVDTSAQLAEFASAEGDMNRARSVLSEARRLARNVGSRSAEQWTLGNLVNVSIGRDGHENENDWASATSFALEFGRLLAAPACVARTGELPSPDPALFAPSFQLLTEHAYYAEDFESSASLAQVWRLVAPESADAARKLALSAIRIGQFTEAELIWRELLIAAPDDPTLYANLSGSVSAQGRYTEAIAALDHAIDLAPDDVRFRRFRVEVKRASGDAAGAIDDIGEIVARCEATLESEASSDDALAADSAHSAPRSQIEYERNMPLRDVLDSALLERAALYEDAGDITRALSDLERVARESDPATAAYALRKCGELLRARGESDAALAALRDALRCAPDDLESIMALGRELVERRNDTEATQVLSRLILHADFADEVVIELTRVIDRVPSNAQARIVRGFAAETAGHPGIAHEDFSFVLGQNPLNASMYFRRARVTLMQGETPQDQGWNESLSHDRILAAMYDFARAATLDPADEDARHSLRWLVDRVCTMRSFHGVFLNGTNQGIREVFGVFPTLERALARFLPTLDLASRGEHRQAVDEWRRLQRALLEIPMPVSVCRIDEYIADSLLRLYDVQGALENLDRRAQLLFLIGQPMSRALETEAVETQRRMIHESGKPTVVLETEFRHVYSFFVEETEASVDMLRIDALGRIGDTARMLTLLDSQPDLEFTADPGLFSGQVNIAARLRDAGQNTRAMALADRLYGVVSDASERVKLLNLRGSINLNLRKFDAAEDDFRAVIAAEAGKPQSYAPFVSLNLTRVLLEQKRFADARTVLDDVKGRLGGATQFEEMGYHWLLVEAALGFNEIDAAKAELETTLGLAEDLRGTLHDATDRVSWQGRLGNLDSLALLVALKAEDPVLLFEMVERTRARAYIDVMTSGAGATPASAKDLLDSVDKLRALRRVLAQLDETMRLLGSTFVDVDLLRLLAGMAPNIKVFQKTPSGKQAMSPSRLEQALRETDEAIARLEERIVRERTAASVVAVGAPLDAASLSALLVASNSTDIGAEAVVLIEFFGTGGVTTGCLVMRSGETVPSIYPIGLAADEMAALAGRAPWGDPDADGDDTWQPVLSKIVSAAVERSNPGDLLWIVPYGPLHQMPLHAARVGNIPLLERNPVCYSPSASMLPLCLERVRGTYASAIVFGDPRDDLKFARAESLSVAARFGTHAFVGAEATKQALMEVLTRAGEHVSVLHLATHGTFDNDDALNSTIELAGSGDASRFTARDIMRGNFPVELVTLSACESGRTRVLSADEPIGLTRAFLTAGASAVLATLWFTDDLSTRLIVERFYDALQAKANSNDSRWRKAQALREASLAVRATTLGDLLEHYDDTVRKFAREVMATRALAQSDRPFAASRHWAPFALIGAWS
jgi:tetratricopeptide (TPR) repeat protein